MESGEVVGRGGFASCDALAEQVFARLKQTGDRLVLAESCTGGLVAGTLARVPGVSEVFCGSSVTYREATKIAWLGVDPTLIEKLSAVSQEVTEAMATLVLTRTSEASVAAAVTGHLGPDAPPELDGIIFVTVLRRGADEESIETRQVRLRSASRHERQAEAVAEVLHAVDQVLART